jgi:hypothetical protein
MTKLNDMKDAPRNGTEILALYVCGYAKKWTVVHYNDAVESPFVWTSTEEGYKEDEVIGWVDLPPIPED